MSLENAISVIVTIAVAVIPLCIRVKGKPIAVPKRMLLGFSMALAIVILSSAIIDFPLSLRSHQSSLPTSSQKQNVIVAVGNHNVTINNGDGNNTQQTDTQDISGQSSDNAISDSSELESEFPIENQEIGMPFVESLSDSQSPSVSLGNWDEENDRDIVGNTYHDYAVKFYAVDMLNSILGYGESDFSANVHIPFGGKGTGTWYLRVCATRDMVGNGSSAEVTIFADDEEIYPSFSLTSSTTDELRFPIELDNVRDVVLHFEGKAIGGGYCAGIIVEGAVQS